MIDAARRTAFVVSNTQLMPVPLVPEVSLHLAHEAVPIWQKTEEELGEMGLPPPFWAFAWAGGQALARYVLDAPDTVAGKQVVDLASGSGLVGIAAMKAGAGNVLAADIDVFSIEAIKLNASANSVALKVTGENLLCSNPPDCDVLLVGDLFFLGRARQAHRLDQALHQGEEHRSSYDTAQLFRSSGSRTAR
jgi:predicted nicotinamide N-methyase